MDLADIINEHEDLDFLSDQEVEESENKQSQQMELEPGEVRCSSPEIANEFSVQAENMGEASQCPNDIESSSKSSDKGKAEPKAPYVSPKEHQVAVRICQKVKEKKLHLIRYVVKFVGSDVCEEVLRETLRIEANGGLMCKNKKVRREPGGVFMTLIQNRVSHSTMKAIRDASKPEDKLHREKSRSKATVQRGTNNGLSDRGRHYDSRSNENDSRKHGDSRARKEARPSKRDAEDYTPVRRLQDKRVSHKMLQRLQFPTQDVKKASLTQESLLPPSSDWYLGADGEQIDMSHQKSHFHDGVVIEYNTPLDYGPVDEDEHEHENLEMFSERI